VSHNIHEAATNGPDRLDLAAGVSNPKLIAEWWHDAKLFVESMESVGRAVLLRATDDGTFYLSSVPEDLTE